MTYGVIRQYVTSAIDTAAAFATPLNLSLTAAVFLVLFTIYDILGTPTARYPASIPHVGHTGLFSTIRNFIDHFSKHPVWMQEGYDKYNRHGRPFVISGPPNRPASIILPSQWTKWYLSQADNVLSIDEAHRLSLHADWNFLDKVIVYDGFHERVIHKFLQRNAGHLVPRVQAVIHKMAPKVLGMDKDEVFGGSKFKEVQIWNTMLNMVLNNTNVMALGFELEAKDSVCRSFAIISHTIIANSFVLNSFPKITHLLLGPLLTLSTRYHRWRVYKALKPHIEQRRALIHREFMGVADEKVEIPEDYLTWHIRLAFAENRPEELDTDRIVMRLIPIEFAAIHTTTFTAHSFFLDFLGSPDCQVYITEIRNEIAAILGLPTDASGHWDPLSMSQSAVDAALATWTKDLLDKLLKLDSALRESQRISCLSAALVERIVVNPEGITAPDGSVIPPGTVLALNMLGTHNDPTFYDDPKTFYPWRFSELYKQEDTMAKKARLKMTTTSEKHLGFGHGRHACPGRFFVSNQLKMIVGYLMMNYDFEMIARPERRFLGTNVVPAMTAGMRMRRIRRGDLEERV